ncbi:rRNA maturation RNase YbeY [Pseudoponticoccus marisrubri]|uniref:Endoribonuclease YbeY n=1 Tax=Pseudoponticoccus marisrubri TaxID=1685382 RepID=A0A0W7WKM8_9RHOB|nr:rRNA maturation RNase YbeY [Pseudoponticoccus marisrubri]KUF11165.1 rRNA maturation factor [Pseudoponticoccus marisrubri]
MLTETLCEDDRWQAADLPRLAETGAQAALRHLGLDPAEFEIAVLGCDDARIAELNGDFRDKPRATNVLSWPSEDLAPDTPGAAPHPPEPDGFGSHHLGDLALAFDTCAREAADLGLPLGDHVTHLTVHGVLHLLGYDHMRDAEATLMERLEGEILGKLGLSDPYRD